MRTVRRYALPVPEWCRVQWASEDARAVWQKRISAVVAAWSATERASVGALRETCLQSASPDALPQIAALAASRGLVVLPLSRQRETGGDYQAGAPGEPAQGEPWSYRIAITTRPAASAFAEAWREGDDEAIGTLLCFPDCCRAFFREVWIDGGWIDTTWPMAGSVESAEVVVAGPLECNILLRWLGVRAVPHLPCSFECERTREFGRSMIDLMASGFPEEAGWLVELLESPVEWSALHGIALIKTPIATVSAKTDATPERLVVRRKGSVYPEAGARGLRFPYHRDPESIRRQDREETDPHDDHQLWTDNGFASREAMEVAHAVISTVAPEPPLDVLDIGCGNGVLAISLAGGGEARGVEVDRERAARAERRGVRVAKTDLWDIIDDEVASWDGKTSPIDGVDLILLMPGRLLEGPPDLRDKAIGWLRASEADLLVYAYGDWLTRHGDLRGLCAAAGMEGEIGSGVRSGDDVEAGVWRWA